MRGHARALPLYLRVAVDLQAWALDHEVDIHALFAAQRASGHADLLSDRWCATWSNLFSLGDSF
jgi:hypothetical protein